MPEFLSVKFTLSLIAFLMAAIPFGHSAWHYYRASVIKNLSNEIIERRKSAAYEWKIWKVVFTMLSLMLASLVDMVF
jgi:hypothetical protein